MLSKKKNLHTIPQQLIVYILPITFLCRKKSLLQNIKNPDVQDLFFLIKCVQLHTILSCRDFWNNDIMADIKNYIYES